MLKQLNAGLTKEEQGRAVKEAVEYGGNLFVSLRESLKEAHNYEIPKEMELSLMGTVIALLTVQREAIISLEKRIDGKCRITKHVEKLTEAAKECGALEERINQRDKEIAQLTARTRKNAKTTKGQKIVKLPVKIGGQS